MPTQKNTTSYNNFYTWTNASSFHDLNYDQGKNMLIQKFVKQISLHQGM